MIYNSSWRAPSNIALIKYWGKYGQQLPRNPSLSFTLSACHTDLRMEVTIDAPSPGLNVLYDGQPKPSFEPKINSFFRRLDTVLPWLSSSSVFIDSVNTFPHAAGIASSASAMSAIALCLADIDDMIHTRDLESESDWLRKVSSMARLGSGSASRSVYPGVAIWGVTPGIADTNNDYAIPWRYSVASVFHDYKDTILIVSGSEKSVSSTAGHQLMEDLIYASARYQQAEKNLISLLDIMQHGDDLASFMSICESEALQLHALMMSGSQPFLLIEPNTISIIQKVWAFRRDTNIPVCFTLDAGPNVHLLYPASHAATVLDWIRTDLVSLCANGAFITDQVGEGPVRIK
ncbi:MAG: diphosphomevalonate decarboxylase [Bacteroidota bacterium]|nr:diphosphomevalonate decarboxylase [Bacteroidota bacterium]